MTSYRGKLPVIIITIALVVFWIITEIISSGKEAIVDDVPELLFSRESGFYDSEFDLTISSSRGEVYYTLDGSIPTCESIHYEAPIHVYDATSNPNVYSMRTDVSTGFYTDLIEEYSYNDPQYCIPDYSIDKCFIVRAVIYYGEDSYSAVKTASYFIGYDDKTGYDGMNVISIVTDPDNLFDYDDGIYVTGRSFDEYRETQWDVRSSRWWAWLSNYSARGIDSEREASIQYYDEDRKLCLSQACGIRIHGGGSRGRNPKSLNLYAREDYDGNDHFIRDFWDNGLYASRITLSQGGDDDITKSKDVIVSDMCSGMEFATMSSVPVIMFLDGEYWGVYWLTEKYDEHYINNHYGVDRDNVIIVKDGTLEAGDDEDLTLLDEMMDYGCNADLTVEDNARELFDVYLDRENTLDYYAAELYISRYADWPSGNWALWRSRSIGNDPYSDGKWRWMLFDVNYYALDADQVGLDSVEQAMTDPLFHNLMSNDEFRHDLMDRISELQYTVFSAENVDRELADYHRVMDEAMKCNSRRFRGEQGVAMYEASMREVEFFLHNRPEYIDNIVDRYR